MFWKKNEKLETIKDLVGSRAAYIETVKMLELEGEEKEIFLRASIEVKKKKPNQEIIDKAYVILVGKSYQGKDETDEEQYLEDSKNEPIEVDDGLVLNIVKKAIGNSSLFMEFVNKYDFSSNERSVLSGAYETLKKEPYDMNRIRSAYDIISVYKKGDIPKVNDTYDLKVIHNDEQKSSKQESQKKSSAHHTTNDSSSEPKKKKRLVLPSVLKKVIVVSAAVLVIIFLYTWMMSDDSAYLHQNKKITKQVSFMGKLSKKTYNTVLVMLYDGNNVKFKNIGKEVFMLNSDNCFVVGENGETISNYSSFYKSKNNILNPGESYSMPMKMFSLNKSKGDYLECSTNTMSIFKIQLVKDDNSDVVKKTTLDNLFLKDGKKTTRKVGSLKLTFIYDKKNNEIHIKNVGRNDLYPAAIDCFIADKQGEPIKNYRPRMRGSRTICGPGSSVALEYNSKIISLNGGDYLECLSSSNTLFKVR